MQIMGLIINKKLTKRAINLQKDAYFVVVVIAISGRRARVRGAGSWRSIRRSYQKWIQEYV